MPVRTLKQKLIQKGIYGHWIRKAVPFAETFWGVTPWRCQYLHQVYGVPEKKIRLLVMGGKDDAIHLDQKDAIRSRIRAAYGISPEDFLVITGGKLDAGKQVQLLLEAVAQADREDLKLLVFGRPDGEMKETMERLGKDPHIFMAGWLEADQVYDYFLAADLAFFPGSHSVLWEQSQACGLPGVFKRWEGMEHVNVHGSALFFDQDSVREIQGILTELLEHRELYNKMKRAAQTYGTREFSYRRIAKKAIGLSEEEDGGLFDRDLPEAAVKESGEAERGEA
jgi:glycosyltransferase involved in cell wall biosynthesis